MAERKYGKGQPNGWQATGSAVLKKKGSRYIGGLHDQAKGGEGNRASPG